MATSTDQLPHIWIPGVIYHITKYLDDNEIACSLRVVSKLSAQLFANRTIVRLSQPAPTHAFSQHWTQPGTFYTLSFKKRRSFLALVAASGCLPNLELALQLAGCDLTSQIYSSQYDAMAAAAAAAGHIHVCKWLLERGHVPDDNHLRAAAKAGRQEACAWLIDNGWPWYWLVPCQAGRGGHPELMTWLLARLPDNEQYGPIFPRYILDAAVLGCDLATCQQLHRERLEELEPNWTQDENYYLPATAASSPTPDWRAKVEWLEALGWPRSPLACTYAAQRPDAVERLQWLLARGYPVDHRAVREAAETGNMATLQFLLVELGVPNDNCWDRWQAAKAAVAGGYVSVLQLLHEMGWLGTPEEGRSRKQLLKQAITFGHVEVVAWMVEAAQVATLEELPGIVAQAFKQFVSIHVELLEWLNERGCHVPANVFSRVEADASSEAVLEWLLAHGYRFPANGVPYKRAARAGDLATLTWLHRHGCPWGPKMQKCNIQILSAGVRAWADGLGLPYGKKG